MDDTSNKVVDEKVENFVIKELNYRLKQVPEQYKVENYNPLPAVVRVLQDHINPISKEKKEKRSKKSKKYDDNDEEIDDNEQKLDELEDHFNNMETAMNLIVDGIKLTNNTYQLVYYQGFATSIKNYSSILEHVSNSRKSVEKMQGSVGTLRKNLHNRSKTLKALWKQNLEYKHMISILSKIQELKTVPSRLEQLIANKFYLHAAKEMVRAVQSLFSEDLMEVGALSDLRRDILDRKTTFHEMLIDELHDLVYLLNPSAKYGNASIEDAINNLNKPEDKSKSKLEANSDEIVEDLTKPPLDDTCHFMTVIVESLHIVDRMPTALSALNNQVGIQLIIIINECMATVRKIAEEMPKPKPIQTGFSDNQLPSYVHSEILTLYTNANDNPLVKLLTMLFQKWLDIARHHVFLYKTIVNRFIAHGVSYNQPAEKGKRHLNSPYTIESVWRVMQLQMEALLMSHLQPPREDDEEEEPIFTFDPANPVASTINVVTKTTSVVASTLTGQNQTPPTSPKTDKFGQKEKKLFSFAGSSAATFKGKNNRPTSASYLTLADPLVAPSPYNITPVYTLVTEFCNQFDNIIPIQDPSMQKIGLRYFVDDFIINTFLNHIQEDYQRRVSAVLDGPDAFKPFEKLKGAYDQRHRPLLPGPVAIFQFVQELYIDALTMPNYSRQFVDIMEMILSRFLDKCQKVYERVVEGTEAERRICNPELVTLLSNDPLWKASKMYVTAHMQQHKDRENRSHHQLMPEDNNNNSMHKKGSGTFSSFSSTDANLPDELDSDVYHEAELALETAMYTQNTVLTRSKLLFNPQQITLLASLNDTLEWFAIKVNKICSSALSQEENRHFAKHWPTLSRKKGMQVKEAEEHHSDKHTKLIKTLTFYKLNSKIEPIVKQFLHISEMSLFALRVEFRLHCYFYLEGIQRASYKFDEETSEPDLFVVELNKELSAQEELLQPFVAKVKSRYLFYSLPHLISSILISSLRKIKSINRQGVLKMCRNVFALQQNLTNITKFKDSYFDKVRKYYLLLNLSEEELLSQIKAQIGENRINSLEDYKAIKTILEFKQPKTTSSLEKTLAALETLFTTLQKSPYDT